MVAADFDLLIPLLSEHDLNREILELAASLALSDLTSLHIVHAWEALAEGILVSRGGMSPEGLAIMLKEEMSATGRNFFGIYLSIKKRDRLLKFLEMNT